MSKVLFIKVSMKIGSERGSISTAALDLFQKTYQEKNPNDEIIVLDLNKEKMAQKTLNCFNFEEYFNTEDTDKYINQLKSVDKIVISSPMTNFNYPGVLKNYFDHILVAKKTFIYKYIGLNISEGLLKHLKVQVITTQGAHLGWYSFANHTETLIGTFKFIGAECVPPVIIAGTNAPENIKKHADVLIKEFESNIIEAANIF